MSSEAEKAFWEFVAQERAQVRLEKLQVRGSLYVVLDNYSKIEVDRDAVRKFFEDKTRVKELLKLHKEELRKELEGIRDFVREVLTEEAKYNYNWDDYPDWLKRKSMEAEELDSRIAEIISELKKIDKLLEVF
ncbi:MAG: hypothetical protein H0Z18_08155 [Thermococcus sp.]|uniref:hypothetical protein n=1 Tax=Thermococcus sp. TaxID=35749 RepID=UPI001DB14DEB|nr:hypothetical protein [Thermococcus sp.]MBO8175216.1 hypothetical protein [Thermococcus sp.]